MTKITPTVQLMRQHRHKIDPNITAVPFSLVDEIVELTLNKHGILETGAMSLEDFSEQFELDETKPD